MLLLVMKKKYFELTSQTSMQKLCMNYLPKELLKIEDEIAPAVCLKF